MPWIDVNKCNKCEECIFACLNNALIVIDGDFTIDQEKCKHCNTCISYCPIGAIEKNRVEKEK
ncbi:MAG: 4Fe-4S binding protein [Candidatus Firestonebacteria bacterium]